MQPAVINGFRLSPQQQRLWLLQQDDSVYQSQCLLLFDGPLDTGALRETLQRIVQRHEILRTSFHSLAGMAVPVQVISDHSLFSWQEVNLTDASAPEQDAHLETAFQQERCCPFDLQHGPLLRVFLFVLAEHKHALLLSLPSLIADAWSLKNLVQEIGQGYVEGEPEADLYEEPMQYLQFSEWQHELLADEDAESGKTFWRQHSAVNLPRLTLPFERRSAVTARFEPNSIESVIDGEGVDQIKGVAERYHTSVSACLLAWWHLLLWRLTGEPDVVVGDACDGRQLDVLHDALGLFVKWLPMRIQFAGTMRYHELLTQLHELRRESYEWQDYLIWDENAQEVATTGASSFFPVGFEWEDRPIAFDASGVSVSVHKQWSCTEPFSLKLRCIHTGESLRLEFHYDSTRWHAEDVQRIARQYETLVQSVVRNPEASVGQLEILSEPDRRQLLVSFNATQADYLTNTDVHHLFEEQAQRTPHTDAVVFGNQRLSYAELNAKANQLAHYLQQFGVGPEVMVGLCVERSLEMLVGIFGILKAGGAYVPLDPTYPHDRLAFMLADTRAPVLVTQSHLLPNLPDDTTHMVCLDDDWEHITRASDENPVSGAAPEHLAYVIYTSGSTGTPKGVMIQHRSAVNLAMGLHQVVYAHQHAPLRVSLNAPLVFDASVKQILQLVHGHTLYIVPEEVRPDGQALLSYVEQNALDVLDCTPAQLQLLGAAGLSQASLQAPRLVLVGGDSLDEATWTALADTFQTRFYNVYGPTECTVDTTAHYIQATDTEPTIGRPLPNIATYVLDAHLQPVPIGVPGDLYIGGAGLARGYLNRAALTAERFIPHPFSDHPGERLYRTGDLASYLPDGRLKFIGRIDHQVKVRGFRIELGEVESVLAQHPSVREAVTVAREDDAGDLRLVAYVSANQPQKGKDPDRNVSSNSSGGFRTGKEVQELNIDELRRFMREKLPEHMIPSAFVTLARLPLTRNGKVDRQALPAPDHERVESRTTYVSPRTKVEQTIARVWQEVLDVESVGMQNNFFDLGGHSLLMVQLHTKLRECFHKEISLIDIFRNPTVSELSKYFTEPDSQSTVLQQAQERAQRRRRSRVRQQRDVG